MAELVREAPTTRHIPNAICRPPTRPYKQAKHVTYAEFRSFSESITGGKWTDERDRLIARLLYFSGMRVGELCDLEDRDIQPEEMRILIRHGKGMRARYVPMHEDAVPTLRGYIAKRPHSHFTKLLVSNDGFGGVCGNLMPEGVRQMLIRRCKRAGMKYLHPHSCDQHEGVMITLIRWRMEDQLRGLLARYCQADQPTKRGQMERAWLIVEIDVIRTPPDGSPTIG